MPERNDARPPLDRADALERVGGDEAFLEELLGLYDEEYAAKSRDLAAALAASDWDKFQSLGHGLKGASANLSLGGLRDAALACESAGRCRNAEAAREALERLRDAYRALKAYRG